VGFYDLRDDDPDTLYIGEFVSATVFPCGEIKVGKGQCGQCASERRVMIAKNVKELENYIACDDDTQSEIVLPCFIGAEKKLRTVLDIDSDQLETFDNIDQEHLETMISLIYN
jgi:GAF domain-containing protein